jgi:hypothetical protein
MRASSANAWPTAHQQIAKPIPRSSTVTTARLRVPSAVEVALMAAAWAMTTLEPPNEGVTF